MRKTQLFDPAYAARRDTFTWTYPHPYAPQHGMPGNARLHALLARRSNPPRPAQMDIFPEQLTDIIAEQLQ